MEPGRVPGRSLENRSGQWLPHSDLSSGLSLRELKPQQLTGFLAPLQQCRREEEEAGAPEQEGRGSHGSGPKVGPFCTVSGTERSWRRSVDLGSNSTLFECCGERSMGCLARS